MKLVHHSLWDGIEEQEMRQQIDDHFVKILGTAEDRPTSTDLNS